MTPLVRYLEQPHNSLKQFSEVTIEILGYLRNVLDINPAEKKGYKIHISTIAGTTKYIRPINQKLFIYSPADFIVMFQELEYLLQKLSRKHENWSTNEKHLIDSVLYTMQQSIGAGFDLLANPNSARKHVGNRFEELMKAFFTAIKMTNSKTVLSIPYVSEEGFKTYKCENDLIISPYETAKSTNTSINPKEIVVSVKTTSKDRMGKIFIDKMLLEKFVGHKLKVIGIFLNDVQRKENNKISFTLVSGLFMVYTKFLIELDGIYYLDPPPNVLKEPFKNYMKPFSELVTSDIWKLFSL